MSRKTARRIFWAACFLLCLAGFLVSLLSGPVPMSPFVPGPIPPGDVAAGASGRGSFRRPFLAAGPEEAMELQLQPHGERFLEDPARQFGRREEPLDRGDEDRQPPRQPVAADDLH